MYFLSMTSVRFYQVVTFKIRFFTLKRYFKEMISCINCKIFSWLALSEISLHYNEAPFLNSLSQVMSKSNVLGGLRGSQKRV